MRTTGVRIPLQGWASWRKFVLSFVILIACVANLRAQTLIDIALNNLTNATRVGFAAIGQTTNDFWNFWITTTGTAALPNLKFADGTISGAGLTVSNAPGEWANYVDDIMYGHYSYNSGGQIIPVTVTNLPPNTYDIYLYGHPPTDDDNSIFTVSADGINYGTNGTVLGPGWDNVNWQEGMQYVVFRNVQLASSASVLNVRVLPSASG